MTTRFRSCAALTTVSYCLKYRRLGLISVKILQTLIIEGLFVLRLEPAHDGLGGRQGGDEGHAIFYGRQAQGKFIRPGALP